MIRVKRVRTVPQGAQALDQVHRLPHREATAYRTERHTCLLRSLLYSSQHWRAQHADAQPFACPTTCLPAPPTVLSLSQACLAMVSIDSGLTATTPSSQQGHQSAKQQQ